ncbi:heptaprenyl diphosphate synthase [Lachnospiraceae bacterium XBB1006]|nr:heptaprenyl diphosphate synthase [Lachnospiraceae bacterium XBB1006]
MKENRTKLVAYVGMLISLAFILSYVESLIPISLGIPGVKLGLANLVVMVALYTLGAKYAMLLSLIRIVLVGFSFGSLASMMYALAGGILSLLVMFLFYKRTIFSVRGVSMLGGVCHNVGQILMAMLVVQNPLLISYFPVLLISGTVAGLGIGLLAAMIIKRVEKVYRI